MHEIFVIYISLYEVVGVVYFFLYNLLPWMDFYNATLMSLILVSCVFCNCYVIFSPSGNVGFTVFHVLYPYMQCTPPAVSL